MYYSSNPYSQTLIIKWSHKLDPKTRCVQLAYTMSPLQLRIYRIMTSCIYQAEVEDVAETMQYIDAQDAQLSQSSLLRLVRQYC